MLPDMPMLKEDISEILRNFARWAAMQNNPPLNEIRSVPIYEGNGLSNHYPTGGSDAFPMMQTTAELVISPFEMTFEKVVLKFSQLGGNMGEQMSRHFFERLGEICDAHGQVTNGLGNNPVEALFDGFEKILWTFDAAGNPEFSKIQIVCGEKAFVAFQKAQQEVETDPNLKKRFEELKARKLQEYYENENSRVLAG